MPHVQYTTQRFNPYTGAVDPVSPVAAGQLNLKCSGLPTGHTAINWSITNTGTVIQSGTLVAPVAVGNSTVTLAAPISTALGQQLGAASWNGPGAAWHMTANGTLTLALTLV